MDGASKEEEIVSRVQRLPRTFPVLRPTEHTCRPCIDSPYREAAFGFSECSLKSNVMIEDEKTGEVSSSSSSSSLRAQLKDRHWKNPRSLVLMSDFYSLYSGYSLLLEKKKHRSSPYVPANSSANISSSSSRSSSRTNGIVMGHQVSGPREDLSLLNYEELRELQQNYLTVGLLNKGKELLKLGQLNEAVAVCTQVIERDPSCTAALLCRAEAHLAAGTRERDKAARQDYSAVLLLDPQSKQAGRFFDELAARNCTYSVEGVVPIVSGSSSSSYNNTSLTSAIVLKEQVTDRYFLPTMNISTKAGTTEAETTNPTLAFRTSNTDLLLDGQNKKMKVKAILTKRQRKQGSETKSQLVSSDDSSSSSASSSTDNSSSDSEIGGRKNKRSNKDHKHREKKKRKTRDEDSYTHRSRERDSSSSSSKHKKHSKKSSTKKKKHRKSSSTKSSPNHKHKS